MRVEEGAIDALPVSGGNGSLNQGQFYPGIDVFHYFLHWEAQFHPALLLEALPLLPVLQPLPEQIQFICIHISIVRTQRTPNVHRNNILVGLE